MVRRYLSMRARPFRHLKHSGQSATRTVAESFRWSRLACGIAVVAVIGLTGCPRHRATAPPAQVPGWSGFKLGFDLTWRGFDANGVPINPMWSAQLNYPPVRPNFQDTCSTGITSGGTETDPADLAQYCTSQAVRLDVRPRELSDPASLLICPARPLRGHMNWGLATYAGDLTYVEWSTDIGLLDDDINFDLHTEKDAGLTSIGEGVHLEFPSSETTREFSESPWWTDLDHKVRKYISSKQPVRDLTDGRIAVVTGLIGVDGVHHGHSESHPVYAMALLTKRNQTNAGLEEEWVFFLRNHGGEGNCATPLEHMWPDFHGSYYVQLPWPDRAQDVHVAGTPLVWSYLENGISSAGLEKAADCPLLAGSPGCTFLRLDVPNANARIGAFGEIKLTYSLARDAAPARYPLPARAVKAVEYEGGREAKLRKRLNSLGDDVETVRQHLPKDIARIEEKKRTLLQPYSPPPGVKPRLTVDTAILQHQWRQTGGVREGSLRPDVTQENAARKREIEAVNKALAK